MTYTFDLDMTPGGVPEVVQLSRYDKKIPELEFTLWNGPGAYIIPEGASVFISGTKPDKTGFEYECTYTNSVVTVTAEEQMTAVAGRVICELSVITAEGKKGSANFYMDIEPSALADDTVISETDIPIIQRIPEILAEVEAAKYLAEQWAVGSGSGQDVPSDTNNAYYWAMQAASYAGGGLKPEIVQALPTTDISTSTLYFVPSQSPTSSNIYDEYINTDGTSQGWELIGTTAIDMSQYYTKTEVNGIVSNLSDSIAPQYDPSQTYGEGWVRMYNNKRYRSNQAITVPEPWTPAHWTEENVDEALSDISTNLSDSIAPQYDPSQTYGEGWVRMYNNKRYRSNQAITVPEPWTPAHWTEENLDETLTQINTDLSYKLLGNGTGGDSGLSINRNNIKKLHVEFTTSGYTTCGEIIQDQIPTTSTPIAFTLGSAGITGTVSLDNATFKVTQIYFNNTPVSGTYKLWYR